MNHMKLAVNKIIAFILIISLLWSDCVFMLEGLISIAEELNPEESQVTLNIERRGCKEY